MDESPCQLLIKYREERELAYAERDKMRSAHSEMERDRDKALANNYQLRGALCDLMAASYTVPIGREASNKYFAAMAKARNALDQS